MTIISKSGVMSSSLPQILRHSRNGKIHSLFRHSFNIRFEEDLVNFNQVENQLSSFGCNIESNAMNSILSKLEIGDLVIVQDAMVTIYSTYGGVIEVDTNRMKVIDLGLQPIDATPSRLAMLANIFYQSDIANHIGLTLNGTDIENLNTLLREETQSDAFRTAVRYLVGRGKGLTPSGDDILMGFFLIQKLFSHFSGLSDHFISYLKKNTTEISVAYLNSLKNGYVSEFYQSFCQAAAQENKKGVRQAVEKIITIGSTSGYDSLLGMNLGISKIECEMKKSLREISNPNPFLLKYYQLTEA